MTRTHRSAGAIVVSADPANATTLLLEQIRTTGERQVVAPKGTIEQRESPLATAAREVQEETGLTDLIYIGFLGQQHYEFTDKDGSEATKTVDWFLVASHSRDVTPRTTEGFVGAEWVPLERATEAVSHASFGPYLERAQAVVAWRRPARLAYSTDLSDIVWAIANEAADLLRDSASGGIGLCGSAARGNFVDGWSDIDIIGWGIDPTSDVATRLGELADAAQQATGIHASIRLSDSVGRDVTGAGPLYDMKLRAVLSRSTLDLPVIAGQQAPTVSPPDRTHLVENLEALRDFAASRLRVVPTTETERRDRARRILSVTCSAARIIANNYDRDTSLRLPDVSALLGARLPGADIVSLIADYDAFRMHGADDLDSAEALAERTPAVLTDLVSLAAGEQLLGTSAAQTNRPGRE